MEHGRKYFERHVRLSSGAELLLNASAVGFCADNLTETMSC